MKIKELTQKIQEDPRVVISLARKESLVYTIVRGIVLEKDIGVLADEILHDPALSTGREREFSDIDSLVLGIKQAIDIRSTAPMTDEDRILAETTIINALARDALKRDTELLKDLRISLALKGHDDELSGLIKDKTDKAYVNVSDFPLNDIDFSSNMGFYVVDAKKGLWKASGPKYLKTGSYVVLYDPTKMFALGYITAYDEQGHTRNTVLIAPVFIRTPEGRLLKKLSDEGVLYRNVPVTIIPDQKAKTLRDCAFHSDKHIVLGAAVAGSSIRRINGTVDLETISPLEVGDDAESRIVVVGATSSGKTIFTNQLQRQLLQSEDVFRGGVVTIVKGTDHLAKVALPFASFAEQHPSWDPNGEASNSVILNISSTPPAHKMVDIDDNNVPDIDKLEKRTLFSLIDNVDSSEQVKTALKRAIEESTSIIQTLKAAERGDLLGDEYSGMQNQALQRLINAMVPINYDSATKVDIGKELEDSRNVAFRLNGLKSEIFGTVVLLELQSQHQRIIANPKRDGKLIVIDECQQFLTFKPFQVVFDSIVREGRNYGFGILVIMQSRDMAKKLMPIQDFVIYETKKDELGRRLIYTRENRPPALIVPVGPG